jgi:glucose-1-phosphate thymidylyltransferase
LSVDPKGILVVADADSDAGRARVCRRLDALEHVANRPIAHHVLDALESAGVTEVVVAVSHERADEVRECLAAREQRGGASLRYVEQQAPVDIAGGLGLAAPAVGSAPAGVHLANGLLGEPLAPFVDRLRRDSPDVVLIVHQGPAPDQHLSAANREVLHIAELDPKRAALGMTGVCLFGQDALRRGCAAAWRADGDVDLTLVGEQIRAAGGSLHVRQADAWHRYAGDPLDLLELNRITLDSLDSDLCRSSSNGSQIEGRVWIHERASVSDSMIVGPIVIGPDACIVDSYIGPYTSVGAGAHIEGAEIERSIISSGASIMHVGGRLVASVVGRDARIFRDFSLPRAMRLRVGDGTEVALC